MIKISNITINKIYSLYQRKNGTRFLGLKSIHHKINYRSSLEVGGLSVCPYYWMVSEIHLVELQEVETQS